MADLSGRIAHIYTTAGTALDGDRTETVEEQVGKTATGRSFRKVAVPQEYLDGQIQGYQSNLEAAYTETDWQLEKQFGNVVPVE